MRVRRFPFVIAALPVLAATTVSTAEAPPANTIRIRADRIPFEPDTLDNTVLVTFLLDPVDYATEIREDAWDMTETGFEAWKTDDIDSVMGWTSFTDSISGMFEGEVRSDSSATNRLYLKLDGTTDIDGNIYNQVVWHASPSMQRATSLSGGRILPAEAVRQHSARTCPQENGRR